MDTKKTYVRNVVRTVPGIALPDNHVIRKDKHQNIMGWHVTCYAFLSTQEVVAPLVPIFATSRA